MPVNKNKKVILLDSFDYLSKELKANDVEFSYVSLNSKSFDEAVLWLNNELFTTDYQQNDLQFIINVNLLFKGGNYEEQKGVDLYRAILHILHDRIETLSFVFYSTLPAALSAKFKPANSVLLHLPYIELPVEDVASVTKMLKLPCPLFNNSSENLLSGFYLTGARPIGKEQNIFIVDDQYLEWEKTLSLIFEKSSFYSFKRDNREEYKKLYHSLIQETASNEVKVEFEEFVSKSDLIISDLYLTENHETGTWKTMSESRAISGFQILERIKKINEFIPLVLFSTSNRARNIYVINTRNISGWCIKDSRFQVSESEKTEFFYEYLSMCSNATTDLDIELKNIWSKIKFIETNLTTRWWYKMVSQYKEKYVEKISKVILNNNEQSLKALRRYYNQQRDISKANGRKFGENKLDEFNIHSVVLQLFKSIELIYFNTNFAKNRKNQNKSVYDINERVPQLEEFQDDISRYLYIVRCNSAHGAMYHNINSNNVRCFVIYIIELLSLSEQEIKKYIKPDKLPMIGRSYTVNYQLLNNISFYNHPASLLSRDGRLLLKNSIIELIQPQKFERLASTIIRSKSIQYEINPRIDEKEALRYRFNEYDLIEFEISESLIKSKQEKNSRCSTSEETVDNITLKTELDQNQNTDHLPEFFNVQKTLSISELNELEEVLTETYSIEIEEKDATGNNFQNLQLKSDKEIFKFKNIFERIIKIFQNIIKKNDTLLL